LVSSRASPSPPVAPARRRWAVDWRGLLAQTTLGKAGLTDAFDQDASFTPHAHRLTSADGKATETFVPDANNRPVKHRPTALESGRFPQSGTEVGLDSRGLPNAFLEGSVSAPGATASAPLFTTQAARDSGGRLSSVTRPGQELHPVFANGFGEVHAVADPMGNATRCRSSVNVVADEDEPHRSSSRVAAAFFHKSAQLT
jgi:hypothetical protein